MGVGRNLLNLQFGRLTVAQQVSSNNHKKRQWLCLCECSGHKIAISGELISGKIKSCGCHYNKSLEDIRLPNQLSVYKKIYRSYRNHAKKRNLSWNLTLNNTLEFFNKNCEYCNKIPSQKIFKSKSHYALYNGIDRKDNTKGYELDNCVTCCKRCNYMKSDTSYHDFINHIKSIHSYLKL